MKKNINGSTIKVTKLEQSKDLCILAEIEFENSAMDEIMALDYAEQELSNQVSRYFKVRPARSDLKVEKQESKTKMTAWFELFSKNS